MAKTDLAFHFNAPSKVGYACKLLRKATAAGARVAVLAPPEVLARLDIELWTFSPLDFVAHMRAPCTPQVQACTPVLLCDDAADVADSPEGRAAYGVLVNLMPGVPEGFDRFDRVIEVVTHDEADRNAARARWKHYSGLGYDITRHDLQLAA
jgi:DNA polymerase III subunit chi